MFMMRWKDSDSSHETVLTIGIELTCQSVNVAGVTYRV
jgi:hypothetical protein